MKLSLARWEYKGSSAGWWMVRELPGVAVVRAPVAGYVSSAGDQCWQVTSDPDTFEDFFDDAYELWGYGFKFTSLACLKERNFPSRSAALLALEAAFSSSSSALPGVLG